MKRNWNIFISSVFFVLGFSVVFSLLGVLLQSVLSNVSFFLQQWLARIGGLIIELFGMYLIGWIKILYLEREHKLNVKRTFKSSYLASFVFGAAFAVGWTPCVGAVLGAVLTLAVSNPSSAFFLLLAYSLGLGIPFLLVGLFTNQAQRIISKSGKWLTYLKYVFGAILILMGVLVLIDKLSVFANLSFASEIMVGTDSALGGETLNIGVAFLAGTVSFLSPCILPLIPVFLSYLASVGIEKGKK